MTVVSLNNAHTTQQQEIRIYIKGGTRKYERKSHFKQEFFFFSKGKHFITGFTCKQKKIKRCLYQNLKAPSILAYKLCVHA